MKIGMKLCAEISETKRCVLINFETKMRSLLDERREKMKWKVRIQFEKCLRRSLSFKTDKNVMKSNTFLLVTILKVIFTFNTMID